MAQELAEAAAVRESVQKYYGETLQASSDLRTSACCTAKPPPANVLAVLRAVPADIRERYYGCGSPFPQGISGKRVLDLGCGTGRDCYVCAALVGESGYVTGVDMTQAQLDLAVKHSEAWAAHLGYQRPNMRFVKGLIEDLEGSGVAPGSCDIAISNCVVNLSPDKRATLSSVHRALTDGGEFYFSDVYCSKRLPVELTRHEVLVGECLGGALYVNDFVTLARDVGFAHPRMTSCEEIQVHDPELKALLGDARFFSVTFRLFKVPGGSLDAWPEDYGHTATYKGTVPTQEGAYALDDTYSFTAGVPIRVDGNTAKLLQGCWLSTHFEVAGGSAHRGMFAGGAGVATTALDVAAAAANASASGGCCAPAPKASSCCGPKTEAASPAAASSSCCAPTTDAPAAAPAPSCCGPPASSSNGCAAKEQAGACCPPKQQGAACSEGKQQAGGGCGPKKCCG